jgi:hypothetical protein
MLTIGARVLAATVAAAAVLSLLGCGDEDAPDPVTDLTWGQLRNAVYPSAAAPGTELQMEDGRVPAEDPDNSMPVARLVDVGAFGDLGGDGGTDAAVFVAESAPEGDQVTSVVAVINDGGQPKVAGSIELGTNVAIRSVKVEDEGIEVREVVADSYDADAGQVQERLRRFEIGDDGLTMARETTATVPTADPEEFEFERTVLEPTEGAATVERLLGPREAAPFVLSGVEGQQLEVSLRSEHDSAVLSIQGLSDLAQIVIFSEYATTFSGELPGTQDYAVRVISVMGSDLDVEMTYELGAPPAPTATPAPTPAPTPAAPTELAAAVPVLFSGIPSLSDAGLGEVSGDAAAFVPGRAQPFGIAVVAPGDGLTYMDNGDEQMETASVIKVVVMACVMSRAEAQGRLVNDWELSLMWPMITESNNDATDALWSDLGGGPGVAACLDGLGAGGITPYNGPYWGTSTASARGIAMLTARIAYGDMVNAEHRAAALEMLTSVIPGQRWGVPAGADASGEEIVGVKDGWYPDEDGWRVNSVGFISPLTAGEMPYAIAVMTNRQTTQEYGIETIEGLSFPVWTDIRAR